LYAAADDLAFDENRRSVFAWNDRSSVGPEGVWELGNTKINFPTFILFKQNFYVLRLFSSR
jgi:hypothetical protein